LSVFYSMQLAGNEANVYIFGDIVDQRYFEGEVSSASLAKEIEQLKDVSTINVHINSYGGMISEGWAIYNALRNHPARIVTHGDGFVASTALYPFMAGDERRAYSASAYFLHCGMCGAYGNAAELRAAANEVEMITEIGQRVFTERAGIPNEKIRELMENETWLTPEQALELGIVTAIVADPAPRYAQSAKRAVMQRVIGAAQAALSPDPAPAPEPPAPEPVSLMQKLSGFFNAKN